MIKNVAHSLIFRIGVAILLVEIIVLALIGGFFIQKFQHQIDERVRERAEIPGMLVGSGLLTYDAVADKEIMEKLVGQELVELVDGMIIGVNGNIFYSLDFAMVGKNIESIKSIDSSWLNSKLSQNLVSESKEDKNSFITSITPLYAGHDQTPYLFAYIKVKTNQAEHEKNLVRNLFIGGLTLAVFIISVIGFTIFRNSFTVRINRLLEFLQKVTTGDLSVRLFTRSSKDELGNVYSYANSMVDQLENTFNKLGQHVTALENTRKENERALLEKEILLKEVHHRVKNNLQIISSLLNLQTESISDNEILAKFNDSKSRIQSMALIHESLYQSENFGAIHFKDYVLRLVDYLNLTAPSNQYPINFDIDIPDIAFDLDTAIPCGLVLNEIINNSIKYAFPDDDKKDKNVKILLTVENNTATLIVKDNGVGIKSIASIDKTKTLGIQLISMLIEDQLDGTVNMLTDDGFGYHLTFKVGE